MNVYDSSSVMSSSKGMSSKPSGMKSWIMPVTSIYRRNNWSSKSGRFDRVICNTWMFTVVKLS